MSGITTHVLDTSSGRPASGVSVTLEIQRGSSWERIGAGNTDQDGRLRALVPADTPLQQGAYRITFDTGAYFTTLGVKTFYPSASIIFAVEDPSQHFHVPLLVSPFGYSTYRGS